MYPLFELSCLLSLRPPGCHRLRTGAESPRILKATAAEIGDRSLLALVINNGTLLFRYTASDRPRPVMRQLPWLHGPSYKVSALCFDPSGAWLLCAAADASLYIIPLLALMDATVKVNHMWSLNDITKIEMSGKRGDAVPTPLSPSPMGSERAQPSSIIWWQTQDNHQIAIVGNELGEICFINLVTRKEVGGTYITLAITKLDLIRDDTQDAVYLLITGSNGFQWQLLLEQPGSGYRWPLEQDAEVATNEHDKESSSNDDSLADHRPQRLAKFAGHTHLVPQNARGRHFITGYYSPTSILSIHSSDLSVVPLFVYKLPPSCEKVIVTDRLLFVTSSASNQLFILSSQLSESSIDGKKEANPEAQVQVFPLPTDEMVIAIYKRSSCQYPRQPSSIPKLSPRSAPSSPRFTSRMRRSSGSMGPALGTGSGSRRTSGHSGSWPKGEFSPEDIKLPAITILDGCIVVTETAVYECKPRISPEFLFLQLVLGHQDLRASERLGITLGLDVNRLYEAAADHKLGQGQFAAAVRLYQLSKCPHVRSVANFAAHGCVAELLSYVQVLFSGQAIDFSPTDKRHFANMELLCYTHQVLEVRLGATTALLQAFRHFLFENRHFSEPLAIQLLAEQGMYHTLAATAERRGLLLEMAEELLRIELPPWLDSTTAVKLEERGYEALLKGKKNESFISCVTTPQLVHHLLARSSLAAAHAQLMMQLAPHLHLDCLRRVAYLYDPSRPCTRSYLKRILSLMKRTQTEPLNFIQNDGDQCHAQRLVETFICILLVLNSYRGSSTYELSLLQHANKTIPKVSDKVSNRPRLPRRAQPIGCGAAHTALVRNGDVYTWGRSEQCCLGHGHPQQECCAPLILDTFSLLRVKVIAVACGASHSIALTNYGVYAWGSSRYGQLGTGRVDKEPRPVMVETLADERMVAVACGQYHSLALTDDGRVFAWGWGVHGQLGHGNPNDCLFPCQVKALANDVIVKVAAGHGHSAVLSAKGEVYTFGCSLFGQLGLGTLSKQTLPRLVRLEEKINLLACGYFHCVAVSASNKLYTWGSNPQLLRLQAQASRKARLQNQLARSGTQSPSQSDPSKDTSDGQDKASDDGELKATQEEETGRSDEKTLVAQLPLQSHLVPSLVESNITAPITQVSCGNHHSAVLTMDGEVYTWGRNLDGQLGNGTRKEQKCPTPVVGLGDAKVTHVDCGSDFTIAVDSDGKVWGWGHNDCGQIGPDSEAVFAPSKTITIKTNKRIVQLRNTAQWGVVKPQEIVGLAAPRTVYEYEATHSFEADRLGNGDSSTARQSWIYGCLAPLATWESPSYGCKSLHGVIEIFFGHYDIPKITAYAVDCHDYQAAAKIALLAQQFTQSLAYQLQSLKCLAKSTDVIPIVIETVEHYIRLLNSNDTDGMKTILEHTIRFWIDNHLPISSLEDFFLRWLPRFVYPLALLLFCHEQFSSAEELVPYVLSRLSTKFCLTLVSAAIEQINSGVPYTEFVQLLAQVSNPPAADAHGGWQPIAHTSDRSWNSLYYLKGNMGGSDSITLHPRELESLMRSLELEGSSSLLDSSAEVVLFTCGHNYTNHLFHATILPRFEESMRTLPYALSRTTQALLASYRAEGLMPMACPRCVLNGIKEGV